MSRLPGKIALVTGAASGLGRAIAESFLTQGARVIVADIDEAQGAEVARALGQNALFVKLDVTSEAGWASAISKATDHFGRLDVLVNNAGIALLGTIESLSMDDWHKMLSVDLTGVFIGCRAALPALIAAGGGSIINISSTMGLKAADDCVGYNAAKAGVTLMTKSIALHCAKQRYNIRCNSIHPGVIKTPILEKIFETVPNPDELMAQFVADHPIGHIGDPSDIANMAIYLASDESKFVTGSACIVDGGSTI